MSNMSFILKFALVIISHMALLVDMQCTDRTAFVYNGWSKFLIASDLICSLFQHGHKVEKSSCTLLDSGTASGHAMVKQADIIT